MTKLCSQFQGLNYYNCTKLKYLKQMADLFSQITDNAQIKSSVLLKRQHFQVEIRNKDKNERKKQLRTLNMGIGSNIKSLVASLPLTFSEVSGYLMESLQHHKLISKLIVDKIYESQLSHQKSSLNKYQVLPLQPPNSVEQLRRELYLFLTLLQNQGSHAPLIFKQYFILLKEHAQSIKTPHLLFDLFNTVIRQRQLNWVPFKQIISIIQVIQRSDSPDISREEVECYFNLSKNYFSFIKDIPEIRNRICKVLQYGSECFQIVKPKLFFNFCLVLTFNEDFKQTNADNKEETETIQNLIFHKAMLKGSLIKNLYRQIFYSTKVKLRLLCLNILGNLIIQLNSSFIWLQQKTNPIQQFQIQIRDKGNSMQMFYAFGEVFLLSIKNIPSNSIQNVLQSQVDCLSLILYILENCEEKFEKGKYFRDIAEECLWLFLEEGNEALRQKVANVLIEKDWKRVLNDDSDIIFHCYKILKLQP